MKDQKWNDPGARAASGVEYKDWLSWIDNNLKRESTARALARAVVDCNPEDRLAFIEFIHEFMSAGWPGVPFGGLMGYAAFWADRASRAEHKVYALACFNRLSPEDRAGFLEYVQRGKPA